jgi:hypothetical protein
MRQIFSNEKSKNNKWNYYNDKDTEIRQALLESEITEISNLEKIRSELVPNYRHPKKMQDRLPDGQVYCMNCNLDL